MTSSCLIFHITWSALYFLFHISNVDSKNCICFFVFPHFRHIPVTSTNKVIFIIYLCLRGKKIKIHLWYITLILLKAEKTKNDSYELKFYLKVFDDRLLRSFDKNFIFIEIRIKKTKCIQKDQRHWAKSSNASKNIIACLVWIILLFEIITLRITITRLLTQILKWAQLLKRTP